ncbi:hypothetical protein [Isoptericola variabilis]|uniref:Pectate lyase/Amb allergen n=1 Tax=Isoptericola variabilis (strain 225) TaxID=743718 RepID=F6FQ51_ISOV2|nr:hypothetical protein [Isoptericola variabilis]AEG44857.1 pectate lyase/Amb allergen [Isoptericola variabilis 225]TWH31619.1 hypothetical protein L600_002200000110 [Isoptericola variabilis J7]
MRQGSSLRKLLSGVVVAMVATGAPTIAASAAAVPVSAVTTSGASAGATNWGAWYESAYATWVGRDDDYRAYVKSDGAYDWRNGSPIEDWLTDWTEVDVELVREVDPARDTWRVDIPGLPRGMYDIQVRAADGTTVVDTVTGLQTESFPRNGAAFVPSDQDVYRFPGSNNAAPDGVVGGYLPDGRIDPDADVVYLTPETMEAFPATVFTEGRGATADAKTPLVVRVIGTIGSFDTVAASKAAAGAHVPPGVNDSRMMVIGAGNGNVTVEGIGPS